MAIMEALVGLIMKKGFEADFDNIETTLDIPNSDSVLKVKIGSITVRVSKKNDE